MADPVSSGAITTSLATVTALSLLPGTCAPVVLGAFAGAVVFVVSSSDLSLTRKIVFLIISFVAGCLCAPMVAQLIDRVLPEPVDVSEGVGALVASALAVRLLLWLIRCAENPSEWLERFKGSRK